MKDVLEYVQKQRYQGDLIEIRSPHTAGSIIRAYGAMGNIEGVWDTWNEAWKERKEMEENVVRCFIIYPKAMSKNEWF